MSADKPPLDVAWLRPLLLDHILPNWLRSAVTAEGLFLPQLDRQWRPLPNRFATATSQSRLLYNFAVGYDLTGDARYRAAVESGARFLLDKFRDRQHGGWFHALAPGGVVLDDHKNPYDFAFVIFGLAHAFRVTGDEAFKPAILETWDLLARRFRDPHGGFIRRMTRDFRPNEDRRSQNPIMHLFEALLAAGDVIPGLHREAETIGSFVLSRLMRWDGQPCLPEFYDFDWAELPAEQGGHVSLGHQFEWAYLLSAAVERRLPAWWISPATDLLQFGLRAGYDPNEGGVFQKATYQGRALDAVKGCWEQCEAIRAMIHHAILRRRDDLRTPLAKSLEFVRRNYVDPVYPGWHSTVESKPTPDKPDKGGPWKVDYHVVGMCSEALRLAANACANSKK